jgi:hypothetical protein
MEPSPLLLRPTGLLYQPRVMTDDDEFGAIGGMTGRGNRSTGRKPDTIPLCPPQIPHDLTQARTRAAAEGSRRLTACAMARPTEVLAGNRRIWKLAMFMYSHILSSIASNILVVFMSHADSSKVIPREKEFQKSGSISTSKGDWTPNEK